MEDIVCNFNQHFIHKQTADSADVGAQLCNQETVKPNKQQINHLQAKTYCEEFWQRGAILPKRKIGELYSAVQRY